MGYSTYKDYELQAFNSNNNTWGTVLNDQVISYLDQNMGGIVVVTLSSSDVTLSVANSRNVMIRLQGALLANVIVTINNNAGGSKYTNGFFFVENLTSGNFTVSVRNASVATAAIVPQGTRATLISDTSNGVRLASSSGFATGTTLTFLQTSAPTGWTKSTASALDNAALRIVTSSGGSTSGTANFTNVFAARTIAKANLPDFDVTITDPTHDHDIVAVGEVFVVAGANKISVPNGTGLTGKRGTGITAAFGSTARPGSQTTMDFAVKYVDAIVCVKD